MLIISLFALGCQMKSIYEFYALLDVIYGRLGVTNVPNVKSSDAAKTDHHIL